MNWQTTQQTLLDRLQRGLSTSHGRVLACAVLFGFIYLPTWGAIVWSEILSGSSSPFLNLAFIGYGVTQFWQRRDELSRCTAETDDRILGYACLFFSIGLYVATGSSASAKAVLAMGALIGVLISTYGLSIFSKMGMAIALLVASLYPSLIFISNVARQATTSNLLEQSMAHLGAIGLSLIGYRPSVSGEFLSLPEGAVQVGSGCSGFDMAFTLGFTGFLVGLFMKRDWKMTSLLVGSGIATSLVFNIPRIMVLAIASIHWGKQSFEFWHGPIGGQIFSCIMFTFYYYLSMWLIDRKPVKPVEP
jgi:exosortase/archaeosortase family protein